VEIAFTDDGDSLDGFLRYGERLLRVVRTAISVMGLYEGKPAAGEDEVGEQHDGRRVETEASA